MGICFIFNWSETSMEKIYLDHAATSPLHPKVIAKMTDAFTTFGNPSSIHSFGREARKHLDDARTTIAASIGANRNEIIFTSSGTEADNLAIIGTAHARKEFGKHIITTEIEHPAVLQTCRYLEKEGFEVTYLPVDKTGMISVKEFEKVLREDTILVTIMFGNNEVGTLLPVKEIGEILTNHQAYFHTDAVQAYGVQKINVNDLYVDLLSVSAHKINGPKGVGFLYMRDGTKLVPTLYGGEQELKRRAGTENLHAIVGFATAVEVSQQKLEKRQQQYRQLKQQFIHSLRDNDITFHINGNEEHSLPHVLNISFTGIKHLETMLVQLDMNGIAASSGSACTAGTVEYSHVLSAMFGQQSERLNNSIRFSFGLNNTEAQIIQAVHVITDIVHRLQK